MREKTANGWVVLKLRPHTPAEIQKPRRAGVRKSEIARRLEIGRTYVRRILG